MRVVGHQAVAPGVDRAPRRRAARRVLPLGLGRQPRAAPGAVGRRVAPGHVDHGVPTAASLKHVGARPRRLAPPRAVHRQPPLDAGHCFRGAGPRRGVELEVEDEGPAELLRVRLVGRRGDELRNCSFVHSWTSTSNVFVMRTRRAGPSPSSKIFGRSVPTKVSPGSRRTVSTIGRFFPVAGRISTTSLPHDSSAASRVKASEQHRLLSLSRSHGNDGSPQPQQPQPWLSMAAGGANAFMGLWAITSYVCIDRFRLYLDRCGLSMSLALIPSVLQHAS